jgi:hypothetical protein
MARHEFRFIVSDIDLSAEHQDRIGRAVAQAGALALAEVTPSNAVTVPVGPNIWWRGIPPQELQQSLEQFAAKQVQG